MWSFIVPNLGFRETKFLLVNIEVRVIVDVLSFF